MAELPPGYFAVPVLNSLAPQPTDTGLQQTAKQVGRGLLYPFGFRVLDQETGRPVPTDPMFGADQVLFDTEQALRSYFMDPVGPAAAQAPAGAPPIAPAQNPSIPQALAGPSTIASSPIPDIPPPAQVQVAPLPDLAGVRAGLDAARPGDVAPRDEFADVMGGLAAGVLNRPANSIGELILNAGAGVAGGLAQGRQQQQRLERDQERELREYALQRAETELSLAQTEQQQAQSVLDAKTANEASARAAKIEEYNRMSPRVLSTNGGVITYEVTGPDGETRVIQSDPTIALQIAQAKAAGKALGGGDSVYLDTLTSTMQYGSNDPMTMYTTQAALDLDQGLAQSKIGPELWQEVLETTQEQMASVPYQEGQARDEHAARQLIANLAAVYQAYDLEPR